MSKKEAFCVETLLNMKHSGVDQDKILLIMLFTALSEKWHVEKVLHYAELLNAKVQINE